MIPQGKNTLVCTIIPICKQKSEEMTHGHAELEPQVISANPTVKAGTLNAYERLAFKKWPLYDTHDCGELHQMQKITGLTLLSPTEIIFFAY